MFAGVVRWSWPQGRLCPHCQVQFQGTRRPTLCSSLYSFHCLISERHLFFCGFFFFFPLVSFAFFNHGSVHAWIEIVKSASNANSKYQRGATNFMVHKIMVSICPVEEIPESFDPNANSSGLEIIFLISDNGGVILRFCLEFSRSMTIITDLHP